MQVIKQVSNSRDNTAGSKNGGRVDITIDDETVKNLNSWVLGNIKKKECVRFIKSATADGQVCFCGYRKNQHIKDRQIRTSSEGREWNPEKHIQEMPTDAFGYFTIKGSKNDMKKYVRASNNTSSEVLYEMMTKQWKLGVPNLLISVTGGAKNFTINTSLKNIFLKELLKSAQTTGAWIITGGTHNGVMKHIGDAVQDFTMFSSSNVNTEIVTIGIAAWGIVHNRDSLISKAKIHPAEYTLDEEKQGILSCLDNNHTHFILVDDGTHARYGVEMPLRSTLEKFLSEQNIEKGGVTIKIPLVLVVLEGDEGVLDNILNAMKNNMPCVIVEGSGRIADVISQVANMNPSNITILLIKEKLSSLLQDNFKSFTEKQIIEWTKKIQDIVRASHLLTIYRQEKDAVQDINELIVKALLKASQRRDPQGNGNLDYQLKLAVSWNRLDIAKKGIANADHHLEPADLHPVLTAALTGNNSDFVQLVLDHSVDLEGFVKWETLTQLYNNIEPGRLIRIKLEKLAKEEELLPPFPKVPVIQLHHVSQVLQQFLGEFTEPLYPPLMAQQTESKTKISEKLSLKRSKDPQVNLEYPKRDLLIWAILQNRRDLAEIFWPQNDDCIVAALACCKILKELANEEEDADSSEEMLALAKEYEQRAIDVFSKCFRKNAAVAGDLLTRVSDAWGGYTCLELAMSCDAMDFMSHGGVQMFLTRVWWGKLNVHNHPFSIVLAMLFFPLIYTDLVTFRDPSTEMEQFRDSTLIAEVKISKPFVKGGPKALSKKKPSEKSCLQHFLHFYHAPVVIFFWNVISYIGFLWLFAYVLMIDFQDTPSWKECVLYAWMFSITCEEARQCFSDPEDMGFVRKFKLYIRELHNKLDVLAVLVFVLGLILRLMEATFYKGRVVLALDFILFCFRLMHIFTVSKVLGPKIIIMQRMMKDIFFFVFLLGVWIVSYGVAKQTILVHNEQRTNWIFRNVIYGPYLTLYGDIPSDVDGLNFDPKECSEEGIDPTMSKCSYNDGTGKALFPEWLTMMLLCFYLLFANILLMNLLIAMFSYTFTDVQDHTDQTWKFQRFTLIEEYYNRPPAPPPFIMFNHIFYIIKHCIFRLPTKNKKPLMRKLEETETRFLLTFEASMRDKYLLKQQQEKDETTDKKILDTSNKVNNVVTQLGSNQETRLKKLEDRLAGLENQTTVSLNWIVNALTEMGFGRPKESPPVLTQMKASEGEQPSNKDTPQSSIPSYHVNAREPLYPDSKVKRFPVPDEMVPWQVKFPIYAPARYSVAQEQQDKVPDSSVTGKDITAENPTPMNPVGRTGIQGLGSLKLYGPNNSVHLLLTRWKKNKIGSFTTNDSKKVLEILAVKYNSSKEWTLPGGLLGVGDDMPPKLQEILKSGYWKEFRNLLETKATEVYKGYLDDPRNTDNAWIQTTALHLHFEFQKILDPFSSNLLHNVPNVTIDWLVMNRNMPLSVPTNKILQKVADLHGSYF